MTTKEFTQSLVKNPYLAQFIVFEGIDGSGKSTQAKLLCETMQEKGIPVIHTAEPTKVSIFGNLVRFIYTHVDEEAAIAQKIVEFFNGEGFWEYYRFAEGEQKQFHNMFQAIASELTKNNFSNLHLFIQLCMIFDREDHRTRTEIPALQKGTHVISDRDYLSTLAYGSGGELDWKELLKMQLGYIGYNFIAPNVIFLLDIPVELGLERTLKKQEGKKELFDEKERLLKIQDTYYAVIAHNVILKHSKVFVIDGNKTEDVICQEIWKIAEPLFTT